MIAKIEATGLPGLTEPVILDPKGVSTVTGPSGSGKSMTLEAVCFALFGTDSQGTAFSAAGFGRTVEVALTMSSGTVVRRRKTTSGSQTREITPAGGETESFTKEPEFRARLKAIGQDVTRYILAPLAWVPLAQGAGGGRPLRDLLSSILPPVDLRAIIRESVADLTDADPIEIKAAEAARTAANRAASESDGAVTTRESVLEELAAPIEGPDEEAVADAQAVADAADAWWKHQNDAMVVQLHNDRVGAMKAARDDFAARLEELGERPDDGAEKLAAAEAALATAREKAKVVESSLAVAVDALRTARHTKEDAERARANVAADPALASVLKRAEEDLAAMGDGTVCPTCNRDGWKQAADSRDRLGKLVESTKAKIAASRAAATDAAKADLEAADEAVELAERAAAAAESDAATAHVALKQAEMDASTAHGNGAAARAWDSARKALGTEPAAPADLVALPDPPADEEPPVDAVEAAARVLREAADADAARKRQAAELAAAETKLAEARAAADAAKAAAARAERLVDAVRAAPTEAVWRQMAALGDLGPVSLEFPPGGGCDVMIFGRPWQAASTGELVMADVWLRAGLRHAIRAPWLALWVDNRQSWSGELPDVTPRVELRTVEATGKRLSVAA